MPSGNNLPPIWDNENLKEDVDRFEALQETKEIKFKKCKHKNIRYCDGGIRCTCGAGWFGSNVDKLWKLLVK